MNTNTENDKVETETTPPRAEPAAGSTFRAYVDRARTLAKEHPTAALVVAVGAGALFAAEFTLGALAGIGATMLLNKRGGAELRARMARQSEEFLSHTREQGEKLFERGKAGGEELLRRGRALWPFGGGPGPVGHE